MGCPYEPRHPHATPWAPRHLVMADARPSVCPGYTTTLPEVQEVVVATPHWEHGTLRDLLGGAPSPAMLAGLSALRAGIKERDAAALEERTKGGA